MKALPLATIPAELPDTKDEVAGVNEPEATRVTNNVAPPF